MRVSVCENCEHSYIDGLKSCPWCGCNSQMSYPSDLPDVALDTECYIDYWLCKLDGVGEWQLFDGHPLDVMGLRRALTRHRIITFNGLNYDVPLIAYALSGASNEMLKRASDDIIQNNLKSWQFYRQYGLEEPRWTHHVDIMQVLPGRNSLKLYGAKIHAKRLQDLPYTPDARIGPVERWRLREYCQNDLDTTKELHKAFAGRFELRRSITETYGIDVMSKSDPQIAEAVMRQELGFKPEKAYFPVGFRFAYTPPKWADLDVRLPEFSVKDTGKIDFGNIPPVVIDSMGYRMGIGGLHSSESSASWFSDDEWELSDHDVASYYPSLILQCGVSPKQIGGRFPEIYRSWYDRRLIAKRDGVKDVAEGLKTFLNGTFGKLSEPHSMFYSPPDFIQVTLTGQIALLMLIRDLSQMGIRVVSANTDGIVVYCHRTMLWLRDEVIAAWERRTGLTMEMTRYRSIHSRDVNNYIAIKSDGGVKLKGDYAPPVPVGTSWPSPSANVCVDAVVAHITRGDDVARTICATSDVRGFLFAQKVAGGAVWQGEHLGRVARWYWSTNGHTINYITNGNKVPLSDGAVPMMELADSIPDDVDVGRYIQRAERILQEIGYGKLEAEI